MSAIAKNTAKQTELIDEPDPRLPNLLEREGRIERCTRNAYYEQGLELQKIRDEEGGLYKAKREQPIAGKYSFQTWEEYLDDKWDLSYRRAHELIEASQAAQRLENMRNSATFQIPSRESHMRALLKLETDDERRQVYEQVLGDTGGSPRAKDIDAAVERHIAAQKKNWITLEEWESLSEDDRNDALNRRSDKSLNKQDNASIEWAQWSWNPVTGCEHNCPYCYARDIAHRFYPQGFRPSLIPERLESPFNTKVPDKAEGEVAFRNVFTCSMADLFGRWVPDEWIDAVMSTVEQSPEWNFLFLTKFPQRFSDLPPLPQNAWMGTTVDCQDRVANAEKAFAKVEHGTKWLSIEPMLTPIKFKRLELFDWVVIGGSSKSNETPAWVPPFDWVVDLHNQARAAGCAIYHKDNLFPGMKDELRLREFPWNPAEDRKLPDALKYLNIV